MKERARHLRAHQTDAERHLWKRLRRMRAEGYHFRRQAPIGPYVVDFACHRAGLVIEVDGGQHDRNDIGKRDSQRTAWLEDQGYSVLRFWNNEVLKNRDGVMQVITENLVEGHPTPGPSPSRGGA